MRGIYRRLSRRWGKRSAVLIFAALGVLLCLGGGAVYAKLGGQGRPVSSSDIELQRGLVGWWKLDGNAKDSTPYADNGTVTGSTVTTTTDRKGRATSAYLFDGSTAGNYIDLPYNSAYNSNSFTVSTWLYPTSSSVSRYAINRGDVGATDGAWSFNNSNSGTKFLFSLRLNGATTQAFSATNFSLNAWHHVVGVYDGTRLYLYTDGSLVNSVALTGSVPQITDAIRIGSDVNNSGRWPGGVDDLRVYNRALSAAEVKALYDQYGAGVAAASGESGLVGWWKFDGNARDSTPRANNGTVTGATLTTDRKGRANSAYSFSGTSNYISTTTSGLPYPADSHTVSAWIYPTGTDGTIEELTNRSTGGDASIRLVGGNLNIIGNGGLVKVNTGVAVSLNQWHHVAYSYAGNGTGGTNHAYCAYLDGQQLTCGNSISDGADGGALQFTIGGLFDQSRLFTGKIDDVRVYSRVLSTTEIAAQYNSYDSQINLNSSPTSTTSSGNINTGLVGYWPFNGNARDATPYSDNGTVNVATLTTDRKGRANSAYSFNGSNATILSHLPQTLSLAQYSVSLWVKAGAVAQQDNASVFNNYQKNNLTPDSSSFQLSVDGGNPGMYQFHNDAPLNIPLGPVSTVWQLLTVTYDGATLKGYVNGTQAVSQGVAPSQAGADFRDISIGINRSGTVYFNGTVDEVRVYSRALSATEVQSLYQSNN